MPEWRWGRTTVARSAVLGALAVEWAWASAAGSEGCSSTPVSRSGTSVQVVQVLCVSSSSPCLFCFVCSELQLSDQQQLKVSLACVCYIPPLPPQTHTTVTYTYTGFLNLVSWQQPLPLFASAIVSVSVMEYSFTLVVLVTQPHVGNLVARSEACSVRLSRFDTCPHFTVSCDLGQIAPLG